LILLLAGLPAVAETAPKAKKATTSKTVAATKPKPTSIRGVPVIHREPYLGMIAIDGETGKVLAEDNADGTVYPASVIKLMTLSLRRTLTDHVPDRAECLSCGRCFASCPVLRCTGTGLVRQHRSGRLSSEAC
jgi:ferredoxin